MKKISRKKMINSLVDKEIRFLLQNEEDLLKRMKCKYRNMPKKLLKTYYRDNISDVLLGDGIWVDTKGGYKIMTVDHERGWDASEFDDIIDDPNENQSQLELFEDEPTE
ncbi:uncharacterized protein METZ01_LOCUS375328 [marine metagenome]|uniref:Uncharacterized protein n=1 Tax=marine metagenome TaxID=408172 RepID=A0A382TK36_9ZZZZ